MRKHKVKVQCTMASVGPGLFAVEAVAAGKRLPVKGPWFRSLEEVHDWVNGLEPKSGAQMSERVIRIDVEEPVGNQLSLYKVATGPAGFVNHYTGLASMPNCELVWKGDSPLGEHSLELQATKNIKEGAEWLLNYGPHHPVSQKRAGGLAPMGRTRNRKRARVSFGQGRATPQEEAAE